MNPARLLSTALSVLSLEFRLQWVILVAALPAGLLPLALIRRDPADPGLYAEMLLNTASLAACLVALLLELRRGFAREGAGFLLAQPIPVVAVEALPMLASWTLGALVGALSLLPSLILGRASLDDLAVAWAGFGESWTVLGTAGLHGWAREWFQAILGSPLLTNPLGSVLVAMGLGCLVTILARPPYAMLLIEGVALLVLLLGSVVIGHRAWAQGLADHQASFVGLAASLLLLSPVLARLVSGWISRLDLRRGRRWASLVLWAPLAAFEIGALGVIQVCAVDELSDTRRILTAMPSPDGRWLLIWAGVEDSLLSDLFFLANRESGASVRLESSNALFVRDGTHLLAPRENGQEWDYILYDLQGSVPTESPCFTGSSPVSLPVPFEDARRVLVYTSEQLLIADTERCEVLSRVPFDSRTQHAVPWNSELLAWRFHQGEDGSQHVELSRIDPKSGARSTLGDPALPGQKVAISVDPAGRALLLRSDEQTLLLDLPSLEVRARIESKGKRPGARFLESGEFLLMERTLLRFFSAQGQEMWRLKDEGLRFRGLIQEREDGGLIMDGSVLVQGAWRGRALRVDRADGGHRVIEGAYDLPVRLPWAGPLLLTKDKRGLMDLDPQDVPRNLELPETLVPKG